MSARVVYSAGGVRSENKGKYRRWLMQVGVTDQRLSRRADVKFVIMETRADHVVSDSWTPVWAWDADEV